MKTVPALIASPIILLLTPSRCSLRVAGALYGPRTATEKLRTRRIFLLPIGSSKVALLIEIGILAPVLHWGRFRLTPRGASNVSKRCCRQPAASWIPERCTHPICRREYYERGI